MKRRLYLALGLLALLLAMLPFTRALDFGIINLDDYLYLTSHRQIVEWQGWETIRFCFTDVSEAIWMPLTWLSFAFDCNVFGSWYGGYHLHSLFVHLANSCLVCYLLTQIFKCARGESHVDDYAFPCLIAALVWAIHPLRCESVVFVSSRKDVLSFFWELLALISWLKGSQVKKNGGKSCWKYTAAAMGFFVIGSMCKPSVVTFPVLCLLLDLFVVREVQLLRYLAPALYMVVFCPFAAWQQNANGTVIQIFNDTLFSRLLGAAAAFGIYLRNFVWPQWLAPQCVKTWPDLPRFLFPGLVISGLWGLYLVKRAFWYWDNRSRIFTLKRWADFPVGLSNAETIDYLFVGASWFVVAIGPMLGIVSFGYHAFADRFTYIPAVGLSILLVVFLQWLISRVSHIGAGIFALLIVGTLAGWTWWQTGFWENDYKLFSHTLEVDGDQNACAHGILANWYFEFPHDLTRCNEEFDKASSKDIRMVMGSYEVYIMSLAESERTDEIAQKVRLFEEEVTREFGEERARKIWSSDKDITPREAMIRSVHSASKVAWWLSDKSTISIAEEFLSDLTAESLEKDPIWNYLKWRLYKLKGDTEKADVFYRRLLNTKGSIGYTRFRYLQRTDSMSPVAESVNANP